MKNFSLKKHVAHVHEEQKHTVQSKLPLKIHVNIGRHEGHKVLVITNDFCLHFEGNWRLTISSYVLNENSLILSFYSQIKPLNNILIICISI